jgi:uncharacterized protein
MLKDALKSMLDVQELDVQMIRLMRLKRERTSELERIRVLRDDLHHQVVLKEGEIIELKKQVRVVESDVGELKSKAQRLEAQQSGVRKVEEFNALTHEISSLEREKAAKEQRLSDSYDKLGVEEEFLKNLKSSFDSTKANTEQLETEIKESIDAINTEGRDIMQRRAEGSKVCDPELMGIYEKLLQNKKDRVIVPIESRCCSGCHIMVTAQHENLVRKGERLMFCEHCSRIHYWHDQIVGQDEASLSQGGETKRRRRSVAKVAVE